MTQYDEIGWYQDTKSKIVLREGTPIGAPPPGTIWLYADATGALRTIDDAGTDSAVGGATSDEVTLAADADVLLSLSTQEIGLDVQNANEVFAGPATGADADPTFRALVAADLPMNQRYRTINYMLGGGTAAIATGIVKGDLMWDFDGTLLAWTLLADQSGAIKIDVWKDTYANFPPTNDDSICNGHEPEIAASAAKAQDTDLADWSDVTIAAGDIWRLNVDSCATITACTLCLKVRVD